MNIIGLLKRYKIGRPKTEPRQDRTEVTISGSGGQGIILAGKIFAEAASVYGGKEAVMCQSYGPEARGGASRADIIISSSTIKYPKVMRMDVLLAMTEEAIDKYGSLLKPEGLLIIDETFVKTLPGHFKNVFKTPFTRMAINTLNVPIVANIIALGALGAITKLVTREALIKSLIVRVSQKILVIDRLAIDMGFKVVKDSGFKWNGR